MVPGERQTVITLTIYTCPAPVRSRPKPNLSPTYKLLDLLPDDLLHPDVVQLVVVAQLLRHGAFTHGRGAGDEDSNWLEK